MGNAELNEKDSDLQLESHPHPGVQCLSYLTNTTAKDAVSLRDRLVSGKLSSLRPCKCKVQTHHSEGVLFLFVVLVCLFIYFLSCFVCFCF